MIMDMPNNDVAFWIAGYIDYLRDVVGAANATQLRYLPTVRRFIATCSGSGTLDWTCLSVLRVMEFIQEEAVQKRGHGRTAPASATRTFLRFLAWRGVAPIGLDRAIPRSRRARHASLPTHLSSEQLGRLLQHPAAPSPATYRDRAILSQLAGLGLRASEVAILELDDLDWHAGQLRLRAGKGNNHRRSTVNTRRSVAKPISCPTLIDVPSGSVISILPSDTCSSLPADDGSTGLARLSSAGSLIVCTG
jgi:site-specific recombinase XerD